MIKNVISVLKNHGIKPALKTAKRELGAGYERRVHKTYYDSLFPNCEVQDKQNTAVYDSGLRFCDVVAGTTEGMPVAEKDITEKLMEADYYIVRTPSVQLNPSYRYELMRCVTDNNFPAFVYTDCFGASEAMLRFKPDYAPDNLTDRNYMGNCVAVRSDCMDEEAWESVRRKNMWALNRHMSGKGAFHIAKPLYADFGVEEERKICRQIAVSNSRPRRETAVEILKAQERGGKKHTKTGKITIIIPNRNHMRDLRRCLESVIFLTDYIGYEILVIENNSTDDDIFSYYGKIEAGLYDKWQKKNDITIRILKKEGKFNYSAINNYGVGEAAGELIVLLNNDTKVICGGWLKAMAKYAVRDNTGAVGACLLYADRTVQHMGIIVGIGPDKTAVHQNAGVPFEERGDGCGIHFIQNVSAVTGACLMVKKSLYKAVGGLDKCFALAYNDVDFCLKLRDRGLVNVYVPDALLYHFESKTRGKDIKGENRRRFLKEAELFRGKWKNVLEKGDTYYNPNLSGSVPWKFPK